MAVYATALAILAVGVVAVGWPATSLSDALFWIPLLAAANLTDFEALPELDLDVTLGGIVIIAAAVLTTPPATALFALVGLVFLRELRREAPPVMTVFNRAQGALSGAAASAAAGLAVAAIADPVWQIVVTTTIAALVLDLTNIVFVTGVFMLRRGLGARHALRDASNPFPRFALNTAVSALLSLLLVVLVRDVGRWAVLLMLVPLWLSHSAQRSAREAQDRAEELADRVRELELLHGLSRELLGARSTGAVATVVARVLSSPELGQIELGLGGGDPAATATTVPVDDRGAVLILERDDHGLTPPTLAAAAGLVGLAITRLAVEEELAATERARAALSGRILEEATHERNRIALEIHDDVLPLFAASQMRIDMLEVAIEQADVDAAHRMVDDALRGVEQGIAALRDMLGALRDSTVTPGTLVDGLQRLLVDLRARTGVRGSLTAPEQCAGLPYPIEVLVYETMRGCLANVERHAAAATVHLELHITDGTLVALMQDDGRGFDPIDVDGRRHGLTLARQRAELARGHLEITSAPGHGTGVRLEVPVW